jgi:aspartyl-tRNA(Asn)/glutamyl-tRNA(Gln) amidotransferase subunit C
MSEFDREAIRRVAALAHLALSDAEEQQLASQLGGILEFVKSLSTLDTEGALGAAPAAGQLAPALATPHLRDDELRPSLSPEAAVRNAPASVGSAVSVPKILE